MKIKDAIAATGLTDRAIRLYIEEGLLFPDTKQSYSGRRNIDFSDADIEKLKNISTLRRAGFSIAQIKALDEGGEAAATAFSNFIAEKEAQHKFDGMVLAALESFSMGEDAPTIENVAMHLNNGFLNDKENNDLKPSKHETIGRVKAIIFATIAAVILGIAAGFINDFYKDTFRFPVYNGIWIVFIPTMFLFCTLFFSIYIIVVHIKKTYTEQKIARRDKITRRLAALIGLQIFFLYPTVLFSTWIPFFDSKTTDIADYLVLDEYINYRCSEDIYQIFPAYLPKSTVTNTESNRKNPPKYYYCFSNKVDAVADVYAQWTLPKEQYIIEKSRILAAFPNAETEYKGNYTVLTIRFSKSKGYFAYNDETSTLRYGYAYRLDWHADPTTYFDNLTWQE